MEYFHPTAKGFSKNRAEFPIKRLWPYEPGFVGWGAYLVAGDQAKLLGMKNAMIVTTGMEGLGILEEVQGVLKSAGISNVVYPKARSNPKDFQVMDGYKEFLEAKCDSLVSIGGGSSHDCAKGIRTVFSHDGKNIREFEGPLTLTVEPKVPHLAINTTSGTGSEVSSHMVVNHTEKMYKMVCSDPGVVPSFFINDPLFHQVMPGDLTAYTGMDALTHAVEAVASRLKVESAVGSGLYAIKLIFENLGNSVANRGNDNAIEQMVWAELMAAYCFSSAGLGIVHSMAHTLGGSTLDTPHGMANAIGLINVERYNLPACPERFKMMAQIIGLDVTGLTDIKAGEKFIDALDELRYDVGLRKNFLDVGMKKSDVDKFSETAMHDLNTVGNPRDVTLEDMKKMFLQCMGEEVDFGTY